VKVFELVEVSLGDIFVFYAPLDTIVVLVFCILQFFLHGGYYQCFGKFKEQAISEAC